MAKAEYDAHTEAGMNTLKPILIVDDEPPARARLRALIDAGGLGSVIGEAADGIQTLELAAELHPDIVLLDVRMPGMNGLEAARRLAEMPRAPAAGSVTAVTMKKSE